jgi:enoyl-[acyl-carrier protein] reductase I
VSHTKYWRNELKLLDGKTFVVMGLAPSGIALAIGQEIVRQGGSVVYGVQSERHFSLMKRRGFSTDEIAHIEGQNVLFCDVTDTDQIRSFAAELTARDWAIHGLVHSIAFANPNTMLGDSLFEATNEDIATAIQVSAASLVQVMAYLKGVLVPPASVVALTFESQRVMPNYAWMHVCKAALEAEVRGLAVELGPNVRVNAISAGPLDTMSAKAIPDFDRVAEPWAARAPLGWDIETGRELVAEAACELLGSLRGVTGQVLRVDGGFHLKMF